MPASRTTRPRRACVIRQGFYPFDPRVRREAVALAGAGFEVDVICQRDEGEPARELVAGVRVFRLPVPHERGPAARYALQYLAFLVAAGLLAGALHLRRRYRVVQVHTLPDALVFAALIPKLLGARVLLDLHEMMPEFFGTKFGDRPLARRVIAAVEQASIRFADFAYTCTNEMRETFIARGADPAKLGVVLNAAEEEVFDVARHPPRGSADGGFVLICHGTVEPQYGIDTAIRAVALLGDALPGVRLDVVGRGSHRDEMRRLAEELGVQDRVRFSEGWVPIDDLLEAIAGADAGIVAMKRDAFRDLTHCNKMYDLVTMRRPVITSRTRSVLAYFDEECFEFFESGDAADLARAIRHLHDDPRRREQLVVRAAEALEPYRWPRQREVYLSYVEAVLDGRARPDEQEARPWAASPSAGG